MWGSFWKRRWQQEGRELGVWGGKWGKREVREKEKGRQHRGLGPNETQDLLRTKAPLQVKALPCRPLELCPALRGG